MNGVRRGVLGQEIVTREEDERQSAALKKWRDAKLLPLQPEEVMGLVGGTLEIPTLSPELSQGLFEAPARWSILARFSRSPSLGGAHGVSLKVFQCDDRGRRTIQDFLIEPGCRYPGSRLVEHTPSGIQARVKKCPEEPLAQEYRSELPMRFGRTGAAKISLVPTERHSIPLEHLATLSKPLIYELKLRLQRDPEAHPIEETGTDWGGEEVTVGRIELDPATFTRDQAECSVPVFSPFHSLPEHDPLGQIHRMAHAAMKQGALGPQLGATDYAFEPVRKRVCVVGAGASGMAAADALSQRGHQVVIVERLDRVGGHAESTNHGELLSTDPSFGSYTRPTHPNLMRLLDRLGVESNEVTVFDEGGSWRTEDGEHEWTNSQNTPAGPEFFEEVLQFHRRDIPRVHADPSYDTVSAGDFLKEAGYSPEFVAYYFFGYVIYGFPGHAYARYLELPIRLLLTYLYDTTASGAQTLYSVRGGSGAYSRRFASVLIESGNVEFRLKSSLMVLERGPKHVRVSINGQEEVFDELVLSLQPQHALGVLGDAALDEERELLSGFQYTRDTVYLHTDPAHMPRDKKNWRYLNIVSPNRGEAEKATHFVATKVMPSNHDDETPVFMTFAHKEDFVPPKDATPITRDHPFLNVPAVRLRSKLAALQGENRTWFCGAYTRGLGLHDDALYSGTSVANRILGKASQIDLIERPALLESDEPQLFSPGEMSAGEMLDELGRVTSCFDSAQKVRALDLIAALRQELTRAASSTPSGLLSESQMLERVERVVKRVTKKSLGPDEVLLSRIQLDSLGFIELSVALRGELGLELDPTSLHEQVTIREIARSLSKVLQRKLPRSGEGSLRPMAAPSGPPPIFLLPPLLLQLSTFADLAAKLGESRTVYGLETPDYELDAEALARRHVGAIVESCPERVCALLGYSFGGALAVRIAQILVSEHGFSCPVVSLLDSYHSLGFGKNEVRAHDLTQTHLLGFFLASVGEDIDFGAIDLATEELLSRGLKAFRRFRSASATEADFVRYLEDRRALLETQEAYFAQTDHAAVELPELVYFRANQADETSQHAQAWERHFLFTMVHELPGGHQDVMTHADMILPIIEEAMEDMDQETGVGVSQETTTQKPSNLYELACTDIRGAWQNLDAYRGKISLVVNVASKCAFTPQYDGLERLQKKYQERGLVILGFPSNEFGGQEPGTSAEIADFCATHHGVSFPMFARINTKGEHASPVFQFLCESQGEPAWNFTKYLVGRDGEVVERFDSAVEPESDELCSAIERAIGS